MTKINLLKDRYWRLNNLYDIVDKRGNKLTFKFNWAQEQLFQEQWYCNIILKARQLGMSTYTCLLFLDACLFNSNISAGIIAHTVDDAQAMFRRVKFAYDNLPAEIKSYITADNDTSQMLKFSNGSSLRVGTSLRSATMQYLHVSEFGKICASYPEKAREIISGSLNTVAAGQYIFIESTAEGREGYFYDMCKIAQDAKTSRKELSKLDFKFHFFPWWRQPEYRIGNIFPITREMEQYFAHLDAMGIDLDIEQKMWYIAKEQAQGDDMTREYPSTPEESWEVTNEGLYYCKQMTAARAEGRICRVSYDETLLTHTAWDLGFNDSNAIIFFQIANKELHIIDYEEGSGESLAHWINVVKNKGYTYGKHLAPHDIMVKELGSGLSRQVQAAKLGMTFIAVQKGLINPGIDEVRAILAKCWFDETKCKELIKALDNYKKDWDERHGCFRSQPLHNWASHGADSFRTLATGLNIVVATNRPDNDPGHDPYGYQRSRFGR